MKTLRTMSVLLLLVAGSACDLAPLPDQPAPAPSQASPSPSADPEEPEPEDPEPEDPGPEPEKPADEAAFQLPFPCGQQWRLDTWAHAPALDMVREPDQTGTDGAVIVAPATGTVNQSFQHDNAGNVIQIDHGDGRFSTYLHLSSRSVAVGDEVAQGQEIGTVGADGPTANGHPHLHFEYAIDADGDGSASWGTADSERVEPTFDGQTYGQGNGQTWRNVTSANSC